MCVCHGEWNEKTAWECIDLCEYTRSVVERKTSSTLLTRGRFAAPPTPMFRAVVCVCVAAAVRADLLLLPAGG